MAFIEKTNTDLLKYDSIQSVQVEHSALWTLGLAFLVACIAAEQLITDCRRATGDKLAKIRIQVLKIGMVLLHFYTKSL